jgi:predicted transcriptional regulator
MGHTSSLGVDLHYFSRDVEHHRKQYAEKAMPFLRLETATPSETEKQIEELHKENVMLKDELTKLQGMASSTEKVQRELNDLKRTVFRLAHDYPSTMTDEEIDQTMEHEEADLEILRKAGHVVKLEKDGSFSKSKPNREGL